MHAMVFYIYHLPIQKHIFQLYHYFHKCQDLYVYILK